MALANQQTPKTPIGQPGREQGESRRATPAGLPLASILLLALSAILMLVSIGLIFLVAPTDAIEGISQRIFYFHVPIAISGMLSFGVLAGASVLYLWKKDERWDWLARASAEVGTVFITLTLITGSIWGRVDWGTWWAWDARLTTTLILWFICIGYLMLRSYMGRTPASARSGAVLGIIGVIDLPIIYESVNWWRTLHPGPEIGVAGALPPLATLIFLISLLAIGLLCSFLILQLYQLEKMQTLAERMRTSLE
jgi:heme exporter protein C